MALDPQGRLWVADTGNDRFAIFAADGSFVETWGSRGKGDGQFILERSNGDGYGAIAFAPDGTFYVLDVGNYRVQKFAADRTFLASWGGFSQAPGTYTDPIGIAVDAAGVVYVLDDARDVVERYSADGAMLGSFDQHPDGPGGANTANALGLDAAGNVYVASCCSAGNQVVKVDPTGTLVAIFGAPGSGDGQFNEQPTGIAVDTAGRVFVGAGPGEGQVRVFAADGRLLASWGAEGEFPWGIVLDGHGNVYVADSLANTVTKFRLLPPLAPAS
jgi:sugar lactone lactonase YvrE